MRSILALSLLVSSSAFAQFGGFPTSPSGGGVQASSNTTWTGSNTFTSAVAITPTTNQLAIGGGGKITTLSFTQPAASFTLTFPDAGGADSVVYLALAQTLIAKTLTAPVINGLTSSGSTAIDFSGNSGAFKFPSGAITGAGTSIQLAANANYGCNGNCSFGSAASDGSITFGKATTLQVYAGTPRT